MLVTFPEKALNFCTTIEIQASPETVWGVMSDVERWPEWTAGITSVRYVGARSFALGSRVRISQPRLPSVEWRVTELEVGRGFTWVNESPGARVTGRHQIEPHASGSRVTLTLTYVGPVGVLVGKLIRGLTEHYMRLEAEGLKARSEDRQRSAIIPGT